MTQEQIKQQAREMAERCADAISNFRSEPFTSNPYFATVHSEATAIILRELNLESLLEDKVRLDWLQEAAKSHIEVVVIATFSNNKTDMRAAGKIYYNQDSLRTAITNAMQEKESGE